jgi:hypothetical protein
MDPDCERYRRSMIGDMEMASGIQKVHSGAIIVKESIG